MRLKTRPMGRQPEIQIKQAKKASMHERTLAYFKISNLNFESLSELSHVGKLREVREVRGKLRDKCPTFYAK